MQQQLPNKPALIIISGLPRSGTTWLGKLFDSHPSTLYRHEPDSVERLHHWLPLAVEGDYAKYAAPLQDFVRRLPEFRHPKVSASLPLFSKAFWKPTQQCLVGYSLRLVKALSALGTDIKLPRYCLPKADQDYVLVWKTIESLGRLGLYATALDNKRIIQLFRHPCGMIASQLRGAKLNKFSGQRPSEDYGLFRILLNTTVGKRYGLSLSQIQAMEPIERLAWGYIVSMENIFENIKEQPDCQIILYENLCEKPCELLQELFKFCSLDFEQQSCKFLLKSISKSEKGYFSVFKHPLDSAYKWKKELTNREKEMIHNQLKCSKLVGLWDH